MEALTERFLLRVAEKNNLSVKESVKMIDTCFKKASVERDIPLSRVIKDFYQYLNPEHDKICATLDPEECDVSTYCTRYEDSCVPLYVKDYVIINKDPEAYIEKLSTPQLRALRNLAAHLYFNVGDSGIEDNSFDAIEYHLRKRLKKEFSKEEIIGATPVKKIRADLPFPMPSLDKIRPGEKRFFDYITNSPRKGILYSDKLDGVSGMVVYSGGNPVSLYTRGDGTVGGDVSYLLEYLGERDFPVVEDKSVFAVRGEFVIKKDVFNEKYKSVYSTGRSFIVSQVNKGYVTPSVKDVDFVAYEVMGEEDPLLSFSNLDILGFNVVHHGKMESPRMVDVTLTYEDRRVSSPYEIDGIVLDYNFKRKEREGVNPEYKVAFKMIFEEQLRDTVVKDVEWDISRHGRYNPVAIYRPVFINHVRISRATAHNAAHIRDWNMGVGTAIKVTRSGDVIPQIKDVVVDDSIEPIYPSSQYEWHWSGVNIVLGEIDTNPRVRQKRMMHFFSVIGVAGIGEKTVEKMYDAGLDSIKRVLDASEGDLVKVRGVGKLTAKKMRERIDKAIRTAPLDRFLAALTVTDFKISRIKIKEVLRTFPDLVEVPRSSSEIMSILKGKKIKGIGKKRMEMIANEFPKFRSMLMDLDSEGVTEAIEYQKKVLEDIRRRGYDKEVEGKTFVFTGFMSTPYELEDYIFNNMGDFSSSVVSSTSAVIANTATNITDKIRAARGFGIPVYTRAEFESRLGR